MIHLFQILKDQDGLTTLTNELNIVSKQWNILPKETNQLNLVLDELITNIINHGGGCSKCPIEIRMEKTSSQFKIQLSDGGPPFDPTQCESVDVTLPIGKRECGGLGIHLVRKFSDSCSYERVKGKNIFQFTKNYKWSSDCD